MIVKYMKISICDKKRKKLGIDMDLKEHQLAIVESYQI